MNNDELVALYQTAVDLASNHDLPDLLRTMVDRATALIGARSGAIGLYDQVYDEIELTAQSGVDLHFGFRRRRGDGMVGHVIETHAPLIVDDYQLSPYCDPNRSEPPPIKAALNVPMLYRDELLGVLSLYETRDSVRIYTENDARIVGALAALAASAVKNARLRLQAQRSADMDYIVAGTATRFIHLSPDSVDAEINETLRVIGEFAQVDRSYLFRFSADGTLMNNTHEWCADGIEPQISFLQNLPSEAMPWLVDRFHRGHVTHVRQLHELPDEAVVEREILAAQDIQSVVLIPLLFHSRAIGFIGFDAVRHERAWSEHDIALLKLIAEVFTLALDRAQAERELHQRKQEFETLAEHTPDVLARFDTSGNCLYLNDTGRRQVGQSLNQVVGQPAANVTFAFSADLYASVLESGRPVAYEQVVTLPDHSRHWFHVQLVPELGAEHRVESVLSVSRDVTVLKQTQAELRRLNQDLEKRVVERTAALRASEEQLRSLIDNSLQGIVLYRNGRIVFANRAMAEIAGFTVDELLSADEHELMKHVYADDRALIGGAGSSGGNRSEQATLQFRICRKDGSIRWVMCMAVGVISQDEPAIQAVMVDITELKHAEQALLENKQFTERITNTGPMLIFVYDLQVKRDIYVNQPAMEFFGYSTDQLASLGDSFLAALIHPDDLPAVVSKIERYDQLRDGEVLEQEVRVRSKDGEWHWLLTRDSVFQRAPDGRPLQVVGICVDITDIKLSEIARQEAEMALRVTLAKERELGDLKSRFVSMASHEFRTPLATILANAETLIHYRSRLEDGKINERLNRICGQVDHLSQMIDEILSLTGVQSGRVQARPEPLDFGQFVRHIVDEYANRHDIAHQITCCIDAEPLPILADPKLLRTVVTNLISNAIKYSPRGGNVSVAVGRQTDGITLCVIDKGIGIPERDQKHLFEAFHRASNVGSLAGTGLGLSIAREFLSLMNGSITFESTVGVGTTFEVTLPERQEAIYANEYREH